MFSIKNNKIKITKGDTAELTVTLDGYTMVAGDTLTMTVRKRPNEPVLMSVTSNTPDLVLTPTDTKKLEVGECCYDIELQMATGEVYTVVGVTDQICYHNMTVYPEITE